MGAEISFGINLVIIPGHEPAQFMQFGFIPFIWGDVIKAALAAAVFPAFWQLFKKS